LAFPAFTASEFIDEAPWQSMLISFAWSHLGEALVLHVDLELARTEPGDLRPALVGHVEVPVLSLRAFRGGRGLPRHTERLQRERADLDRGSRGRDVAVVREPDLERAPVDVCDDVVLQVVVRGDHHAVIAVGDRHRQTVAHLDLVERPHLPLFAADEAGALLGAGGKQRE